MAREDVRLCGLNAVLSCFAADPDAIRRMYFSPGMAAKLGPVCKHLARRRRPYRQAESEELRGIAGTVHHGGVVAVMDPPTLAAPGPAEIAGWAVAGAPLLVSDRIGNPHNLGAIIRSAAFFGVGRMILSEQAGQAHLSDAVYRVAEGGMAQMRFFQPAHSLAATAADLAGPYQLVAATLDGAPLQTVQAALAADRAGTGGRPRPTALILGNEETGVDPALAAIANHRVTIIGSGSVQSLNVSAAAAILLHALFGR